MSVNTDYLTIGDVVAVLRKYRAMIVVIVAVIVVVGVVAQIVRPTTYTATLLVDIVRSQGAGVQIAQNSADGGEYRYDGYYRLKADEQMGETVVNWLKTPRVASDIVTLAKVAPARKISSKYFKAHRISPQSVQVVYVVGESAEAAQIGEALTVYVNSRIDLLDAGGNAMFGVRADAPIVGINQKPLGIMAIFWAGIGTFVAFWSVLIHHNLRRKVKNKQK